VSPFRARITLVTAAHTVQGECAQLKDFRKLEDLLNREPAGLLLTQARMRGLNDDHDTPVGPLSVRKSAIAFAWAEEPQELRIREGQAAGPIWHEKAPRDLLLFVPPFRILGEVLAYPEASDDSLLGRLSLDRFFALKGGRIVHEAVSSLYWSEDNLVVNGALVHAAFAVARAEPNGFGVEPAAAVKPEPEVEPALLGAF
jgi:hypothetical protein